MKRRTIFVLVISSLLSSWSLLARAQPANLEHPTKLRLTGTVLPPQEQSRDDLVTVNILVEDKPLLLRIGKIEELTSTEREQAVKWGVLLRQVRFYGPDAFIGQLQKPEAIGQIFIIEGQLDTKARQFLVTAVTRSGQEQSSPR
jgi:hypothetical protein